MGRRPASDILSEADRALIAELRQRYPKNKNAIAREILRSPDPRRAGRPCGWNIHYLSVCIAFEFNMAAHGMSREQVSIYIAQLLRRHAQHNVSPRQLKRLYRTQLSLMPHKPNIWSETQLYVSTVWAAYEWTRTAAEFNALYKSKTQTVRCVVDDEGRRAIIPTMTWPTK
jgi:hypothetical protein